MRLKVIRCGGEHGWQETDLSSISYRGDDVCFTLAGLDKPAGRWIDFVEYRFGSGSRFRVLEEMDLAAYWETGLFLGKHSLYEIQAGGWLDGREDERNLLLVWKDYGAREWLLATTNFSVSVASLTEPVIHELKSENA
jgi:hypothetical protein